MPDLVIFDGKSRTLLVLDDLMTSTDDRVVDLFTKISHHRNLSVVYLTQNIFKNNQKIENGKFKLTLLGLIQNARDASQVSNQVRHMYHGESAFMIEASKMLRE